MDRGKIGWKIEDILLHLELDEKIISNEQITQFLSCLSPGSASSIEEVKRRDKLFTLTIQGEKAVLVVDEERRVIHLLTLKVVETTLEKSNLAVNEILGILCESVGKQISFNGGIRLRLGTDVEAKNIVSKLVSEAHINEVNSKIKTSLHVEGIRCSAEGVGVIFDKDVGGKLVVMAHKDFKEESKDLLKKGVQDIITYIGDLTIKLMEI
jgi:hypothetical protein